MRENTITDHLIAFLLSSRSVSVYRKILRERLNTERKHIKKSTFDQSLYRLCKKGLIRSDGDKIYISRSSILNSLDKKHSVMKDVYPAKHEKVLISFDIPENKKKTRDWLRNQIKYWGFEMVHKSLWLGCGPLPKEFSNRLKKLGIHGNVRVFRIRKAT